MNSNRGAWATLLHKSNRAEERRIDEILEIVRLVDKRQAVAAQQSHGQKQWLEIGMLLAQDPKLLLVDEPAAGMTDNETVETANCSRTSPGPGPWWWWKHDMTSCANST